MAGEEVEGDGVRCGGDLARGDAMAKTQRMESILSTGESRSVRREGGGRDAHH
jgi:hypothetical protein